MPAFSDECLFTHLIIIPTPRAISFGNVISQFFLTRALDRSYQKSDLGVVFSSNYRPLDRSFSKQRFVDMFGCWKLAPGQCLIENRPLEFSFEKKIRVYQQKNIELLEKICKSLNNLYIYLLIYLSTTTMLLRYYFCSHKLNEYNTFPLSSCRVVQRRSQRIRFYLFRF